MPKIGDPFGPKYKLETVYPNSPHLKAALLLPPGEKAKYGENKWEYKIIDGDTFRTQWFNTELYVTPKGDENPFNSSSLHKDSLIQRRIKNVEELEQAAREEALLNSTVYTLMPKLEELQEHLNDVSNKQAELSEAQKAQADDLSNTLADMSIKAGNADDRLDLVEQKTMAMGKKLDTIQKDVNEIKTMVAEIHAALNRRSSSSRN